MRLYVDIDGVFNAGKCYKAWPDVVRDAEVDGYVMFWAEDMVKRLKSLREVGDGIELVWVSSWGEGCRQVAKELGLGEWGSRSRVLKPLSGDYTFPSVYWKAEAIWTDLKYYGGAWAWFDSDVERLWDHPDYKDLVDAEGGFVPSIVADIGITPEILLGLEIRMDNEEWT